MKKFLRAAIAVTAALALTACGSSDNSSEQTDTANNEQAEAADGKTYKIGVLQLTQHTALDKTNQGFIDALDASGIKYEGMPKTPARKSRLCSVLKEIPVNH